MTNRVPESFALLVHTALGALAFSCLFGSAILQHLPIGDGLLLLFVGFLALWMLFPFLFLVGYSVDVVVTMISDSRERIRLR